LVVKNSVDDGLEPTALCTTAPDQRDVAELLQVRGHGPDFLSSHAGVMRNPLLRDQRRARRSVYGHTDGTQHLQVAHLHTPV